jgi:hypothetical protein
VMPRVMPREAEIACSSPACPGNGAADWQSLEIGIPEGGSLVPPAVENPRKTPYNREK